MTINSILEEIINLAKKYSATSNDINTIENVVREMLANPHVDLTRKIRILWRPELYSIQQKYHLPEYKQKSKAFVQKKLVEKLPEMILNEQISQKLFERDYTQIAEEIRNYQNDNYKETTKKIQTQEMLIFPGFFYVR